MVKSVLVVEDEKAIREYIKVLLQENGFVVSDTSTGSQALKLMEKSKPELVLLDLKLPDITGETVCKEIKKNYPETIVIMLTAKDAPEEVVGGFSVGADDYVKKPFSDEELMARINARLKENSTNNDLLEVGNLILDKKTFKVTREGKQIDLTPQEFKLLEYLISNKNQVLTRDMILNRIWLYSPDIESRVVDVYIGYLRKKIDSGFKKKYILSVRGFGYMLKEE